LQESLNASLSWIRLADRYGQRCGGPVILAGLLVGLGVVQLASGPLAQTSRFSLELLVVLVLQLVGPMLVALFGLALLLPRWMDRAQHERSKLSMLAIAAAGITGALLQLLFFTAAICGGVLGTPRFDVAAELNELLGGVLLFDIARACLRGGVFLALLCGWSQWRTHRALDRGRNGGLVVSDQLAEGFIVLLAMKLTWITLIDPLHISATPL